MTENVYLYLFDETVEMSGISDSLLMAVAGAEAIHGRAEVNLDAVFELSEENRVCRVDASSGVGRDIARIFVEFLALKIGEDKFTVRQGRGCLTSEERGQNR